MIKWIKANRDTLIRNSFLLPILLVVIMSISHVVSWYDLGNPISWAIYLSVAIEIFALASVSASSIKMKRGSIWFLFGLVTAIQIVGNIFYEFKDINPSGENFLAWIELIQPLFEDWEILEHRRFLATIQGGTLPLMSLTALHFYIKFNDLKDAKEETKEDKTEKYFKARNAKIAEMTESNSQKAEEVIEEEDTFIQSIDDLELVEPGEIIEEKPEGVIDIAAEIEAKNEEELKKVSEEPVINPEDAHTRANIEQDIQDSRGTTPIYSKEIDTKTGKFVHKKIKPYNGDT